MRKIVLSAAVAAAIAWGGIGGVALAAPPFGPLPVPPEERGGKPDFVPNIICDWVEGRAAVIPNCQ